MNVLEFLSDEENDPDAPFSFRPGSINQTMEYRRGVRIRPCDNFVYSNIVTILVDTEAPTLPQGCDADDLTIECNGFNSNRNAAQSWNEDNIRQLEQCAQDNCFTPIVESNFNFNNFDFECGNAGSLTVTYTVRDQCCLLYTSPSPRDATLSRMPSSA